MKHYLTVVQNDDTAACYVYNDKQEALAAYHTELAYRSSDRTSTLCIVSNANGMVVASEKYVATGGDN